MIELHKRPLPEHEQKMDVWDIVKHQIVVIEFDDAMVKRCFGRYAAIWLHFLRNLFNGASKVLNHYNETMKHIHVNIYRIWI